MPQYLWRHDAVTTEVVMAYSNNSNIDLPYISVCTARLSGVAGYPDPVNRNNHTRHVLTHSGHQ
ncbi:hypothetical protein LNP25_31215 [Klebsiella variicola subsp. variicola]|nr:hypothetical protein [Klebsiella variicola subsp. variicola]